MCENDWLDYIRALQFVSTNTADRRHHAVRKLGDVTAHFATTALRMAVGVGLGHDVALMLACCIGVALVLH